MYKEGVIREVLFMINIEGLVKRYGEIVAVDNVDLKIDKGEIFGLLGPNGAGKTTIINTLTGIIRKDKGSIKLFGMEFEKNEIEIKKNIGVVPQEIAVFDDLTALENLKFFGHLYGLRDGMLHERIEEALEFTGLYDRRKDFPSKYSGGMRRRLNIACAILHHPKLIIMDEPTVGIDPQSRNHILQSVKKLNEQGSTIIYTSHYMEEVEELCNNVAIIDKGRVIAKGNKEDLKSLISNADKYSISLSSIDYNMCEDIKKLKGIEECLVEGNTLHIISKKGEANLSQIIDAIQKAEKEITNISFDRPTLEGVFLAYTGRSLRD